MRGVKTAVIFILAGFLMILVIPGGVVVLLLTILGFHKHADVIMYAIARCWALALIKLVGCPITVSGREYIPRQGGVCFVSNHGSIFDIVLLLAYAGRPVGFVAKKELSFIPLLNIWILLIGGLFIDRNSPRKAVNSIMTGVNHIKSGGAMIIFPEGHRCKGRGMLPFRPGAFKLATLSGAPIVPVAITGSYEVFEKTGFVQSHPVQVVFHKPVNTADIPAADRRSALSGQVRAVIADTLEGGAR
ncbi:MAG: 1-acyl-sn-glycerol-3-phosphate acyltransferase [Spirochaetaceae bacterium]|jgi:1-acyl-sn-glycerol-3-phosphate acyltransferase|nr:1-acyl-sn-glycerol-3-phosphate acyltransferase [Spirochaetaceae bacterium]